MIDRTWIASLLVAISLAGCASRTNEQIIADIDAQRAKERAARAPTTDQMRGADYGTVMTQPAAEAFAKAFFARALKDPDSAKIAYGKVVKGWAWYGGPKFGYLFTASVNAKNGFGAYTGSRPYIFLFHDGNLTKIWADSLVSAFEGGTADGQPYLVAF